MKSGVTSLRLWVRDWGLMVLTQQAQLQCSTPPSWSLWEGYDIVLQLGNDSERWKGVIGQYSLPNLNPSGVQFGLL